MINNLHPDWTGDRKRPLIFSALNRNFSGPSFLYHTEPVQIFGYYFRTYFDFETLPNAKIQ